MRKSNSNAVLDLAQKDVGTEETFRVLTASLPLGLLTLAHWLRLKPAELAPFLTGTNTPAGSRVHYGKKRDERNGHQQVLAKAVSR